MPPERLESVLELSFLYLLSPRPISGLLLHSNESEKEECHYLSLHHPNVLPKQYWPIPTHLNTWDLTSSAGGDAALGKSDRDNGTHLPGFQGRIWFSGSTWLHLGWAGVGMSAWWVCFLLGFAWASMYAMGWQQHWGARPIHCVCWDGRDKQGWSETTSSPVCHALLPLASWFWSLVLPTWSCQLSWAFSLLFCKEDSRCDRAGAGLSHTSFLG